MNLAESCSITVSLQFPLSFGKKVAELTKDHHHS